LDVVSPHRVCWIAVVAVSLGIVGFGASPASAHVWRTYSTGCKQNTIGNSADSANHIFSYSPDLTSRMISAVDWSRANNLDPTDLATFYISPPQFDTDVVVYDQDYTTWCGYVWNGTPGTSGGIEGLTACVSLTPNPAGACEKFEVRFDESATATTAATTAYRRSLACHELGHTLGLEHGPGCMAFGGSATAYSAADVSWINSHY
jgi:hypothetical protein